MRSLPGVVRAEPGGLRGRGRAVTRGRGVDGVNGIAVDRDAIDPTIDLLNGAVPDAGDSFSVLVNEAFVDDFGATSGDDVEVQMFGLDQGKEVSNGIYEPDGPRYRFRVAGVVRTPMDIATDMIESPTRGAYTDANMMMVPLPFYDEHRHEFLDFGAAFDVQLSDGPGAREEFLDAVEDRLADGETVQVQPGRFSERRDALDAPVDLETMALLQSASASPLRARWPSACSSARRAADARRRHGCPPSAGLHGTTARGRRHPAQPAGRCRRHDRRCSPGRGLVRVVSGRHRRPA